MSTLELASMTATGQIIIPREIRSNLHIDGGTKFIVQQDGNTIILKPIYSVAHNEFETVIKTGSKVSKALGLKHADINSAKKEVRSQ